ncbi:MAG: hypothetical protein DHS20C15_18730 [Planctomycetota bacterium]|nr:MAG: hypothetical protein DHS20C15_18730 [Planctomycetota bacterium]
MMLEAEDSVALVRERTRGGALSRVRGEMRTEGDSRRERARDFVNRHGTAFGFGFGLQAGEARELDEQGRRVFVPQTVRGHELEGHGLTVRFDDDERVTLAHGAFSAQVAGARPATVRAADAITSALRDADIDPADLQVPASSRPIARLTEDSVQLIHKVTALVDHRPFALEVDAQSGELLSVREDVVHGTGTFKYGDDDLSFSTRSGKGGVFKNIKAAKQEKVSLTGLPNMSADAVNLLFAPQGSLTGRYVQVLDATGLQIVSPDYLFAFDPMSQLLINGQLVESELFDHVNTYWWLSRMGAFMQKIFGNDFPADYSVPALVNYNDNGNGYLNAYYTPIDLDGAGPYGDGYLVFGEFSGNTGDPMDDFSRDPSIACHEYTHMVVDKAGGAFGDAPLDTPSRAFNEALADYAAAGFLKDPALGEVLLAHGTEVDWGVAGPSLRDLRRELTLQDDLWNLVGGSTGLPQEHEAGNILGSALWRARKALKSKVADKLIFEHLADLPQSTAETGHPSVTPGNATEAWDAYSFAVFRALCDELLADDTKLAVRRAGQLTGAFMSHGIAGVDEDRSIEFDATEKGLALAFGGEFLGSLDEHEIVLQLAEGQQLTLSVKGRKGTLVDFELDADVGESDGAEIMATKPKKVNAKGTKAAQAKLLVQDAGSYRLTLSNTDAEGGEYAFKLKVK